MFIKKTMKLYPFGTQFDKETNYILPKGYAKRSIGSREGCLTSFPMQYKHTYSARAVYNFISENIVKVE